MSFSEAGQTKSIQIVTFKGAAPAVTDLPVPCFQPLETIQGDLETILARIGYLVQNKMSALIEVIYDGNDVAGTLQSQLQEAVAGSETHILRIVNNRILKQTLNQSQAGETLADLSIFQVFDRCLMAHSIPEEQCVDLRIVFKEAVSALAEDDERAE